MAKEGKQANWTHLVMSCTGGETHYPRVCTIWPTPGRFNNGMGFHYDEGGDEDEARLKAKASMVAYHTPHIKLVQDRLDNNDFEEDRPGAWTKEACEQSLEGYRQSIERAGTFIKSPAYESVAIFLCGLPSEDDMTIFMERLQDFASDMMQFGIRTGDQLKIKGVRLVKQDIVITTAVVKEFM